jgi:hypothetical protein
VEYGLRLQAAGGRVGAVDLAITHNSLTINLARLDAAHRRIAELYPQRLPIRTTCGTIGASASALRKLPLVRNHGWRWRWLRHSMRANRLRRMFPARIVIGDISREVDRLDIQPDARLWVLDLDRSGGFVDYCDGEFTGDRFGKPVRMSAFRTVENIVETMRQTPADADLLIARLSDAELVTVCRAEPTRNWVVGIQWDGGWLTCGPMVAQLPSTWTAPPSRPLRIPSGTTRHVQSVTAAG